MHTAEQVAISRIRREPLSFDLLTVSGVLWCSRRFIVSVALASGLFLLGLGFLMRNNYKAIAIVMPPEQSSNSLAMLGAMGGASGSGIAGSALASLTRNPADLYVALMSSPAVETAIVRRFDLQRLYRVRHESQAIKKFEQNSEIRADSRSGLITISVTDHDPQRAAAIANGIIAAYDQTSSRLAITDAQRSRMFFEQEVAETKQNLNRAEEALRATSEKTGVIQPEGEARSLIGYEADLRAQIALKTVQLQSMRVYFSDENPQVQTAQRELQALQAQVAALAQKSPSEAALSSRTVETEASLEYLRRLREVHYNEALYELLIKNLEISKLDEAREGTIVQVVSLATPPDMKDGPHRLFFLIGGLLLGLLSSAAWVVIRYSWPMLPPSAIPAERA